MGDGYEFEWHGTDRLGQRQNGMVHATNSAMAHLTLHRQGIRDVRLRPARRAEAANHTLPAAPAQPTGTHPPPRGKPVQPSDILAFYQQLASLLGAGLPILQALNLTRDSLPRGRLSHTVEQIGHAIEDGKPLADALTHWPNIFDPLSVNLIRTGESAGMLDSTIARVADTRARAARLQRRVRSALTYPMAVLLTAVLVCGLLLTQLVPQFSTTFQNMGAELPALTLAVVNVSDWAVQYGLVVAGVLVAATTLLVWLSRKLTVLQRMRDRTLLRIPVVGNVIRLACLARIFQTLAATLAAGIPLLDALRSTARVAGSHVYERAMLTLASQVSEGQRLGTAVRLNPLFPVMMAQLVATGEESGTLDNMLAKCAEICEQQVEQSVDTLTRLLEPAIMTVLGLVTGTLMLAMYLPIFQLGAVL